MAICSYLVFPSEGQTEALQRRLSAEPGCRVFPAENRDLLLLVTETDHAGAEAELRRRLESMPGMDALVLTFGDLDPVRGTDPASGLPASAALPVLDPPHVEAAVRAADRRKIP